MNDYAVRSIVHAYLPVDRYIFRERTVWINTLLTNKFGVVGVVTGGGAGAEGWKDRSNDRWVRKSVPLIVLLEHADDVGRKH